jgi:hypothetical protein
MTTKMVIYPIKYITNLALNVPKSINVFLISSIGPKTRKATREPVENVLLNDAATNASASEHKERT